MGTRVSPLLPPKRRRPPKDRAAGARALMGHQWAWPRADWWIHRARHCIEQTVHPPAWISDDNRAVDRARPAQSNALHRPGSWAMRPYFCRDCYWRSSVGKTRQTAGSKDDWDHDHRLQQVAACRSYPMDSDCRPGCADPHWATPALSGPPASQQLSKHNGA